MQTTEGEQIAQLIAGYIDIILKKVSTGSPTPASSWKGWETQSRLKKTLSGAAAI